MKKIKDNKKILFLIGGIIVIILAIIILLICLNNKDNRSNDNNDNIKFSQEYTSLSEDNIFVYRNIDEIINILKHGTGVVFLGFPECKWCQAYVPKLNEVAMSLGLEKIYYFNIYNDRKNNTSKYQEIVSILSNYLQYDEEGANKRVYVPTVVAVNKGKIVGFNDESAWDTHGFDDPELYWTKEEVNDLKQDLITLINEITNSLCNEECND